MKGRDTMRSDNIKKGVERSPNRSLLRALGLTDEELDQAAGKSEQMIGLIQQKYGYTRERAQDEYNSRRKAVEAYKDSVSD